MPPRTLTVLAPIRRGEEEALRNILRPIGDDVKGRRLEPANVRPRIEFRESRHIHFARFAILDDPDRGPDRKRLLYSANYDGGLDAHVDELMRITSDVDAIWGRVEGYTGPATFASFIRAHSLEPNAFYIAFRDGTVEDLRGAIAFRRRAQTSIDEGSGTPVAELLPRASRDAAAWAAGRSLQLRPGPVERLLRALPIAADLFRAAARYGVRNVLRGAQRITASLDRRPVFRLLNRLTGNSMPERRSAYSSVPIDNCADRSRLVPEDEVPSGPGHRIPPTFREDVIAQNQLTLVTIVRPGQADRVRAVMAAIDLYAKRLSPPGSLLGISTIHFVKWLVIDNGRRLVMISDYDGSWESYIDEFAEMILSGLDAIWETSYGYPPDGARDLPAFKRFLRSHQVPAEIFFSAYPEETVLSLVNDRALAYAVR